MDTTSLPTGTVTFLFTDIEGSTRLWEQHPEAMQHALARHDILAAEILPRHRLRRDPFDVRLRSAYNPGGQAIGGLGASLGHY